MVEESKDLLGVVELLEDGTHAMIRVMKEHLLGKRTRLFSWRHCRMVWTC